MSLNYDLSKIKDYETVCWIPDLEHPSRDKMMNPVTEQIIFSCLSTGIGEITEANWEEWWVREWIWNKAHGYAMHLTPDNVKAHIGLTTNVFPKESQTKWNKKIIEAMTYNARHELRMSGASDRYPA